MSDRLIRTFYINKVFTIPSSSTSYFSVFALPPESKEGVIDYILYEMNPNFADFKIELLDKNIPLRGFDHEITSTPWSPVRLPLGVPLRARADIYLRVTNNETFAIYLTFTIKGTYTQ